MYLYEYWYVYSSTSNVHKQRVQLHFFEEFSSTANEYIRMQQLSEKDLEEKVGLLRSIEQYRIWPQQTLQKLAQALEWVRYPPASSTISEIYNRPFFVGS